MVLLGRHNLSATLERFTESHKVKEVVIHPDWKVNDYKLDGDIAIIVLKNLVEIQNVIYPVCLPIDKSTVEKVEDGMIVSIIDI